MLRQKEIINGFFVFIFLAIKRRLRPEKRKALVSHSKREPGLSLSLLKTPHRGFSYFGKRYGSISSIRVPTFPYYQSKLDCPRLISRSFLNSRLNKNQCRPKHFRSILLIERANHPGSHKNSMRSLSISRLVELPPRLF